MHPLSRKKAFNPHKVLFRYVALQLVWFLSLNCGRVQATAKNFFQPVCLPAVQIRLLIGLNDVHH